MHLLEDHEHRCVHDTTKKDHTIISCMRTVTHIIGGLWPSSMLTEMHSIASQWFIEHHVNKFALPCAHDSTNRDVAGVSRHERASIDGKVIDSRARVGASVAMGQETGTGMLVDVDTC